MSHQQLLKQILWHSVFPQHYCSFASNLEFLTCFHVFEPLLELLWSEAVLVESIVPFDSLQHLQVATRQPITSLHDHLNNVIHRVTVTLRGLKYLLLSTWGINLHCVGIYLYCVFHEATKKKFSIDTVKASSDVCAKILLRAAQLSGRHWN